MAKIAIKIIIIIIIIIKQQETARFKKVPIDLPTEGLTRLST